MNLFSTLTSKVFGALLLAMAAYHVVDEVRDARALNKMTEERNTAKANLTTARGNVISLSAALEQCNQSAKSAADMAEAVGRAGAESVRQVQQAGIRTLEQTTRRIEAAPAETCEDAEAILRGEAG